eukprot:m.104382 g.104382  ORF g.104382 m.104382 type:complete len:310 (+) comp27564_c0_seq1:310-1239(+)
MVSAGRQNQQVRRVPNVVSLSFVILATIMLIYSIGNRFCLKEVGCQIPRSFAEKRALVNRFPSVFKDDGNFEASRRLARCLADTGPPTRKLMLFGDSNMRKRYLALTIMMGLSRNEDEDILQGRKCQHDFGCDKHDDAVADLHDNIKLSYRFFTLGTSLDVFPPMWKRNDTIRIPDDTLVVFNYDLWFKGDQESPLPYLNLGKMPSYCDLLTAWLKKTSINVERIVWVTTTEIDDVIRGEAYDHKHPAMRVEYDDCARRQGFHMLNGSTGWISTKHDLYDDGYHIRPEFSNKQAKALVQIVCETFTLGL